MIHNTNDTFVIKIQKENDDLVMMVPPGMVESIGFNDGDTLILTKINADTVMLKKLFAQE